MRWMGALLVLLLSAQLGGTAIVRGAVYDADTLDLVERAVVGVDTVPAQSKVTQDGGYEFELSEGNYTVTARKYEQGSVSLEAIASFRIDGNGTYEIDLLLFPRDYFPEEEGEGELEAVDGDVPPGFGAVRNAKGAETYDLLQGAIAVLLFFAIALAVWKSRKPHAPEGLRKPGAGAPAVEKRAAGRGRASPTAPKLERNSGAASAAAWKGAAGVAQARPNALLRRKGSARAASAAALGVTVLVLEPEQKRALSLLSSAGGHLAQKELRARLPYSEAKVSLLLTELEGMGAVKRFKRGRGNIIKLLRK